MLYYSRKSKQTYHIDWAENSDVMGKLKSCDTSQREKIKGFLFLRLLPSLTNMLNHSFAIPPKQTPFPFLQCSQIVFLNVFPLFEASKAT